MPDNFDPAHAILIAADSIERLRKCDVFRLLDWWAGSRDEVAAYICQHRPDLAEEVAAILKELKEGS